MNATQKQIAYLTALAHQADLQDAAAAVSRHFNVSRSKAQQRYMDRASVSEVISALQSDAAR